MAIIHLDLEYVRSAGQYLVASDDKGVERWFNSKDPTVRLVEGRVHVDIDERKWAKRCQDSRRGTVVDRTKVVRKCMRCKREFHGHKVQYICTPCKQSEEFQGYASSMIG